MSTKRRRWWMARDQYGNTLHGLQGSPRKALLERLGRKHADRMFVDKVGGGQTVQIGWIVAGGWWTVYEVVPMERPA